MSAPGSSPVVGPAAGEREAFRLHLTAVISGVAFGLTAPLTVLYATALGANGLVAGAAVSSMSVLVLLVDLCGSRFVPRLEPRATLAISLLVFGSGSAISSMAPNLAIMIGARCLQGIGAALFQGVGPTAAVRLAETGREGRALGRFQAAWFAGIALGPLTGGAIAEQLDGIAGLRLAFGVCSAVSFIGAVGVLVLLPTMPTGRRPEIGLPRLGALSTPRAWTVLSVAGCGQAIRSGLAMTLLPLVATRQIGLGGVRLGAALSLLAIADVTSMYVGGHLGDRFGRRPVLVTALTIGAAAVALTAHVDSGILFAATCLGLGIPVGVAWVVPSAMAVDLADAPEAGLSIYRISADIGLGVGGVLAGAAVSGWGTRGALTAVAGALLVPVVLTLIAGETLRRAPRLSVIEPSSGGSTVTDVPQTTTDPPDLDYFRQRAADQGMTFLPDRYVRAAVTHAGMRDALLRLRQEPLLFLDGVEPASALGWIERGGVSL